MILDDSLRRPSETIIDVEDFDFQLFFRCVQGRSGYVNLSSLVSRTLVRASGDQLFVEKIYFSRRSGNDLNGILALSDGHTDESGAQLGPFLEFAIVFLFGRHNRTSF